MKWLLVSASPFFENRAGILLALLEGVDPLLAWVLSSLVTFTSASVVFLFLELLDGVVRRTPLRNFWERYVDGLRRRGRPYVEKYGWVGLVLFVSLPFPGSGAFSGVLLAYLLGMEPRRALTAVFLGTFLAGLVVTAGGYSLTFWVFPGALG